MFDVMEQNNPHYGKSPQRINGQDSLFFLYVFHERFILTKKKTENRFIHHPDFRFRAQNETPVSDSFCLLFLYSQFLVESVAAAGAVVAAASF